MDELDKKILNVIQENFPVSPYPYAEIATTLRISEEELLWRLKVLIETEVIREISPVFFSKHLGYKSTLVAMEVPQEKVLEVAEIINIYPQVTHNYRRKHKYNLWFTLIASSDEEILKIIEEIKFKTGIEKIFNLPYKKLFKINVNFSL